ncbi:MAG: tRNA pseudouridine(55) synthase TruB [Flavobacteriaceae bacterium]
MIFTKEAFISGQIILIDKPLHWTSFQVVNKVRWLIKKNIGFKKIKVGHAGTLDPLANGLLILCCGKMTKEIERFQGQEKTYSGTFQLGATTPSYDLETKIDQTYPTDHINPALVEATKAQFMGDIDQYPPVYSALKKEGKRLYEYARKGEQVDIPSRKVNISAFSIDTSALPQLSFKVSCSKGTYIRSLVHDYGQALNSGAYLSSLCRERIGDFHLNNAMSIDTFEAKINKAFQDKNPQMDSI